MRPRRVWGSALLVLVAAAVGTAPISAALRGKARNEQAGGHDLFTPDLLRAFRFRNVGPFRMQARASAIAVPNAPAREHLYTFYVATWTVRRTRTCCTPPRTIWNGSRGRTATPVPAAAGSGDEDCDGFTQVRVDPNNDQTVYMVSNSLLHSTDGGRSWSGGGGSRPPGLFPNIFGDVRTFWIDPQDSNRMIIGDDGGFSMSHDGGKSSDHIAHLPIGEPYGVSFDMDDPHNIYASLQDHED